MSRARFPIFLVICSVTMLVWVPSASAAPDICTAGDIQGPAEAVGDPQGVTATHLFAKVDNRWVEPEDVCLNIDVFTAPSPINANSRALSVSVFNTVDGGFLETHLAPGTRISVGLELPEGMLVQITLLRGHGGTVVSNGDQLVIQADTAPWDWYPNSSFGSLDCTQQPVSWESTFGTYSIVNPAGDLTAQPFAGTFFETNAVYSGIPMFTFDGNGVPNGLGLMVQGCGDSDPSTLEGYYDGFVPMSYFEALGMTDQLVRDLRALQDEMVVSDMGTGSPLPSTFDPARPDRLLLEPVPGAALPSLTPDGGFSGMWIGTDFSY